MNRFALFSVLVIGLCAAAYYVYMMPDSSKAGVATLVEPAGLDIAKRDVRPPRTVGELTVDSTSSSQSNTQTQPQSSNNNPSMPSPAISSRDVQADIEGLLLDKSGGAVRARTAVHVIVDSEGFSNLVSQLDFHAESSPNTVMYEASLEEGFRNLNNEIQNATILYDDFACTENMCIGQVRIYGNDESYNADTISEKILSSINEQEEYSNTSVVSHMEDQLDHQLMNYIINFPSEGDAPTVVMENAVNQELRFVSGSDEEPASRSE
ncbi:hypothetical protein [Pseudoteredinibacter isoporae]|uniref:Uncharacterized protein n=1 Tax=Pseudoteredinibacter isoporae TaxID=570281 RepID=A0A7X0JS02_9GAMM|nr:hypothetical protein [Pseudoteredinibacter isoporae]MBB6521217.1 hypothetical protein [Pseudoteredinibacter isoporae]NHO86776.1 hypothetical protein [Pseudoteredinibacter isoporae]NIB24772.1 hypothetical protein [Pseudoteredinibacter isoporae]